MTTPGPLRRLVAAGLALAVALVLGGAAAPRPPANQSFAPAGPSAATDPASASPFDGTPAAGFPEGADGIVLPPALTLPAARRLTHHPTFEDIPASEVAAMLGDVRAALIETRVAETMLLDHNPRPYIDTQAPHLWETWRHPNPVLSSRQAFTKPTVVSWATKLAEGVTLATTPSVAGDIMYEAATTLWAIDQAEIVRIETRFVWVYALRVAGEPGVHLVVLRDRQVFEYPAEYSVLSIPANHGIHHAWEDSEVRVWGVDCDAYAEGLISPARSSTAVPPEAFVWPGPLEPVPAGC